MRSFAELTRMLQHLLLPLLVIEGQSGNHRPSGALVGVGFLNKREDPFRGVSCTSTSWSISWSMSRIAALGFSKKWSSSSSSSVLRVFVGIVRVEANDLEHFLQHVENLLSIASWYGERHRPSRELRPKLAKEFRHGLVVTEHVAGQRHCLHFQTAQPSGTP